MCERSEEIRFGGGEMEWETRKWDRNAPPWFRRDGLDGGDFWGEVGVFMSFT